LKVRLKGCGLTGRGFSKKKRFDCPLISMAAVIGHEGFIIKSQIYPGDVSENLQLCLKY
jgi:hypothetical protein